MKGEGHQLNCHSQRFRTSEESDAVAYCTSAHPVLLQTCLLQHQYLYLPRRSFSEAGSGIHFHTQSINIFSLPLEKGEGAGGGFLTFSLRCKCNQHALYSDYDQIRQPLRPMDSGRNRRMDRPRPLEPAPPPVRRRGPQGQRPAGSGMVRRPLGARKSPPHRPQA